MKNFLFSFLMMLVFGSSSAGIAIAQPLTANIAPGSKTNIDTANIVSSETTDGGTGYYVGIYGGYADRHIAKNALFGSGGGFTVTERRASGLVGRFMAGYQYSTHLGIEVAYTALPDVKANIVTIYPTVPTANTSSTAYLLDLLFKGQLELPHGVIVYGKGGVARVRSVIRRAGRTDANASEYRPAFALGLGYRITQKITLNTEWYRVTGKSNAYDGMAQENGGGVYATLPRVDMFLVGINYRF